MVVIAMCIHQPLYPWQDLYKIYSPEEYDYLFHRHFIVC
jgi:hypothetical protein